MSFHEDMFHETKRERKFYEKRKQKALEYIDHTIRDWHEEMDSPVYNYYVKKLQVIKKMVYNI